MTEFHDAIIRLCPAYKRLSETKLKGWNDSKGYVRPELSLGAHTDYAAHYAKVLLPLLTESHPSGGKFLDLGCAPGGLCTALTTTGGTTQSLWKGVGVTLDPKEGGLAMQAPLNSSLVEIRYADVNHRDPFLAACVKKGEERTFDFVNLGIVLDGTVKMRSEKNIPYCQQLTTQLHVALKALASGGSLLIALKLDFPTLPEVIRTFGVFLDVCSAMRMVPTMYTATHGRKQFYFLAQGLRLDTSIVDRLQDVWEEGRRRYVAFATQAKERNMAGGKRQRLDEERREGTSDEEEVKKRTEADTLVAAVMGGALGMDFGNFCDVIRTALIEGHIL